ncbi:MAG: (2Fe-2S)-binding protein [Bacteroidetes bacterium]|nr:(2Fe-2S)-binding protein [Bacteroidota bacterium]
MAKIVIENLSGKVVNIHPQSRSILAALQGERVDWMHACGGKGRCTTCKLIIVEGHDLLSERTAAEMRYYQEGKLLDNERLACQAIALGDLVVRVPPESKLPHLKYDF